MTTDSEGVKKYYGKYKGTVTINVDPELRGRIICMVPTVLGPVPSGWCEPCTPLAGPTGPPMGVYMVPPPGTGVWVEFEGGDVDKPIWSGCRFAPSNVPPLALAGNPADPNICILKSTLGAMIVVNDSGIYISNGKGAMITLIGTAIDFNVGALTILK
jgi:hypothetical protein